MWKTDEYDIFINWFKIDIKSSMEKIQSPYFSKYKNKTYDRYWRIYINK